MHAVNRFSLCEGWFFSKEWSEDFLRGEGEAEPVRIPHNVGTLPLHYADPSSYTGICGYRRILRVPEEAKGKRLFLTFDGAAHAAEVYINGVKAGEHFCGYTSFRVEITDLAAPGQDNLVAVRLDTTENPSVPPYGFVIDYLTYGGLYREVWYEERNSSFIEDIFITTPKAHRVQAECTVCGSCDGIRIRIYDENDMEMPAKVSKGSRAVKSAYESGADTSLETLEVSVPGAALWDVDEPHVYTLYADLIVNGETADTVMDTFGFRRMTWKADGFYLNGRRLFLHGLNRHQSYPYIGYAAPASLQYEDARILKEELSCNAVRTSHYPQSQHFADACDQLGLLVFTEIPGWQHVGDEAWKDRSVQNTREMVLQYRNHPSVFLWGVRINESQDDDEFYIRTNEAAHELDPTRATSGVRYLEKSHLLEDVYAFNDFSHNGLTPGCRPKRQVTPDMQKPFFISECNGHMFPTKPFDPWEKRQEHALRHARVLHAAMKSGEHAGCFEWCMFDYQTHKDFGSGDRVCYHGVLDMFRNPKLAASVHAAQGRKPVLEISSPMDIGDYAGGQPGDIYAFTNADEVRLYKNDVFVTAFIPEQDGSGMHLPLKIDDTIGELLETQEDFEPEKAGLLRRCLLSAGKYGFADMPAPDRLRMGYAMLRYGISIQDGHDLYAKYVGNWGGESTVWRFDAVRGGKVVKTVRKGPAKKLHAEVTASSNELREGDTYDMAAVRIRITDDNGNTASYAQLPVHFEVSGGIDLIGPEYVTAEGGMCGTYVRTKGRQEAGSASLRITVPGLEAVTLSFSIS